jgi:hypothetical protein
MKLWKRCVKVSSLAVAAYGISENVKAGPEFMDPRYACSGLAVTEIVMCRPVAVSLCVFMFRIPGLTPLGWSSLLGVQFQKCSSHALRNHHEQAFSRRVS